MRRQEPILALLRKHIDSKGKQAKLKSPQELQELLDVTRQLVRPWIAGWHRVTLTETLVTASLTRPWHCEAALSASTPQLTVAGVTSPAVSPAALPYCVVPGLRPPDDIVCLQLGCYSCVLSDDAHARRLACSCWTWRSSSISIRAAKASRPVQVRVQLTALRRKTLTLMRSERSFAS